MKLKQEEQETIIRWYAGSKTCEVVTADPNYMHYMKSQGYEPDARRNPWGYKSYTVDGRPRVPKKNRRPRSQAQMEASLKALEKMKQSQALDENVDQNSESISQDSVKRFPQGNHELLGS